MENKQDQHQHAADRDAFPQKANPQGPEVAELTEHGTNHKKAQSNLLSHV